MNEHGQGGPGRRRFVEAAMYTWAFAMMTGGCFLKQRDPGEPLHFRKRMESAGGGPDPLPPTRVYPPMPEATVSISGVRDSVEKAVREAVAAAGGLDDIESGQTVMIKPNMCGPAIGGNYPGRITTSPEVLRAVIRICRERGAKVMVGDRSMFGTELAMKTTGFARACKEEGAVAFPWTRAEYVRFHPGKRHWKNGYRIPKILQEVDHFINLPLLKNHGSGEGAQFTCCMKAFVGVIMPLDRHQEGPDALHTNNISEKIAELNLCLTPTMNIVDATQIMVKGGPDGLKRKESIWCSPGLVLASRDRVACDSVALAVLKKYGAENKVDLPYVEKSVWDHAQIYYAAELGIGQANPSRITIEDVSVGLIDEIKDNWV